MGRIKGDEDTIKQGRAAKPGDPSVYIDWSILDQLPEQFEAVVTKVSFDSSKDWVSVGNDNFMPDTNLVYAIAKACGVNGYPGSNVSAEFMEVNYNDMEMKEGFVSVNMRIGYKSVKQSWVLQDDGTKLDSSPCSSVYNAWDRANALWSKEESYTDGYKKPGKYSNKYDTKYKRKAHFNDLLKFAQKVAETQAFFKTIRELAGLKTGYKKADISKGYMIFSRIRKSDKLLKLETAAHLKRLESGQQDITVPESNLLFGASGEQEALPEPEQVTTEGSHEVMSQSQIEEAVSENDEIKTPEQLADDLESIMSVSSDPETCQKMINWLKKKPDISTDKAKGFFNKALTFFNENDIIF